MFIFIIDYYKKIFNIVFFFFVLPDGVVLIDPEYVKERKGLFDVHFKYWLFQLIFWNLIKLISLKNVASERSLWSTVKMASLHFHSVLMIWLKCYAISCKQSFKYILQATHNIITGVLCISILFVKLSSSAKFSATGKQWAVSNLLNDTTHTT